MRRRGFTLIELMIVISIISVIAAIAVPNLIAARKQSNEVSVIGQLRAILTAQNTYRDRDYDKNGIHDFARNFNQLRGLVDTGLATTAHRYDYNFTFLNVPVPQRPYNFRCRATCATPGKSGENGYFIDATGVIRICDGNNADETDPPLGGK